MERKSYRHPLRRRILIGCFLIIAFTSLTMGLISFFIFRSGMMGQYETHVRTVMELTLSRLDVSDLEQCMETREPSEKFTEFLEYLDQVRRHYELEYIVLIRPVKTEGGYDVMQVASGLLPEERRGVQQKEIPIPLLGDMIGNFYPSDFLPVVYSEMVNLKAIKFSTSTTEFGRTYDGVTSIHNAAGEGIALLTAGMTLKEIDSTMKRYMLITLFAGLALIVVFLSVMALWMQVRIVGPLKKIESSAADFAERSHGQKDPSVLVLNDPNIHSGDELESLSKTLVNMSHDMKSYVSDLLDSAAKIDDMQQKVTKMNDLAFKDALTCVKNKAAYDRETERIDWDIVNGMADFGIVMVDLNHLKRVNDMYGHEKGDIYIKNMCSIICETFEHSPVFRVGGDEFVVVLRNHDLQFCESLIARLKEQTEALQRNVELSPWERVSAAVGYARFERGTDDGCAAVFKRADKAMYENKKAMNAVRTE